MTKNVSRRLGIGAKVTIQGREHTVLDIIDVDRVKVLDKEVNLVRTADVSEIEKVAKPKGDDLVNIPDEAWLEAERRYQIILPLLKPGRTAQEVGAVAAKTGKSSATLYRWISRFDATGAISSLVSNGRSDKGVRQLAPETEQIIDQVVRTEYLTTQRKSIATVILKVRGVCLKQNLTPPHGNTIRNRIAELSAQLKLAKRKGPKAARETYGPVKARTQAVAGPWDLVEMDNWVADIVLVDDLHRRPLGRPWVTLAIDNFSKMVLGFSVSFDKPSALNTGLCLIQTALRKTEWLVRHDVDAEWPCHGLPKVILSDNGPEFRNKVLQRACADYQIDLTYRPLGRPNYGGGIERLFRTLNSAVHELPGTTFSNSADRGDYDSNKHATFTLFEFERWLTIYILKVYHEQYEEGLKMSPRAKFEQGIRGTPDTFGGGLPPEVTDTRQFRLDFLPFEERTIQRTGVKIFGIDYWEDTLRGWVNAVDPKNTKLKRKFLFRVDPRDIHVIWFLNPDTNEYEEIGYKDKSHPQISRWELNEILNRLSRAGRQKVDEGMIFAAHEELSSLVDESRSATRKAHLEEKRQQKLAETTVLRTEVLRKNPGTVDYDDIDFTNLKPFD